MSQMPSIRLSFTVYLVGSVLVWGAANSVFSSVPTTALRSMLSSPWRKGRQGFLFWHLADVVRILILKSCIVLEIF